MSTTTLPPIMFEVCEKDPYRYDLSKPFRFEDRAWATNGHILIWCPAGDYTAEPREGKKFPNPTVALEGIDFDGAPEVTLPECVGSLPCDECEGRGSFTGVYVFQEDYPIRLRRNGEDVTIDCPECEGSKTYPSNEPVEIVMPDDGHIYLMARYIGLLRRHGVRTARIVAGQDGGHVAGFSGPGFDGILKSMDAARIDADKAFEAKRMAEREARAGWIAKATSK
jgi:hypothetical protein